VSDAQLHPSEVEVVIEPPAPSAPPVEAPPESPAEAPREELPQSAASRIAPRPADQAGGAGHEAPSPPVVSADSAGSDTWTFSPTRPQSQTELEKTAREKAIKDAVAAGVSAVVAEAEKKAADRQRKPLIFTPRDLGLGLVPGSQYVSIARDRVRNSTAPINGHALLEFWTDRRGLVARVRVLNASSDLRAWDDVAESLAEDARSTFPLKIPSNADGLIVTIDVTSALKTLSGGSTTQNPFMKALQAVQNPADALMDSRAAPQRVVAAKVVSVEAF
jgi:hypothetical protein